MVPKDPSKPNRVVLNKNARFFWEDVPFGLVILKDIGRILGVKTPNVTKQIVWHQKFMPVKYVDEHTGEFIKGALVGTGAPSAYGIKTPQQLVATSLAASGKMQTDIFFKAKKAAARKKAAVNGAPKTKTAAKLAPKRISKASQRPKL